MNGHEEKNKECSIDDFFDEFEAYKIEIFGRLKFMLNSIADIERRINKLEERDKE